MTYGLKESNIDEYNERKALMDMLADREDKKMQAIKESVNSGASKEDIPASSETTKVLVPIKPLVYRFPYDDAEFVTECLRYKDMSAETLEVKLRNLATNFGIPREADEYVTKRNTACAISIALNLKLRYPPFIRASWKYKIGTRGKLDGNESIMSNDLKVIDLHWLYCNQLLPQYSAAALDQFDFSTAAKFVAEKWKSGNKTDALGIPYTHMLSLKTLKSKQVYDRHSNIFQQINKVPSLIREALLQANCRIKSTEKELIDIAKAMLLADGNFQITKKIYAQISGSTISEVVLRKRMNWLKGNFITLSQSSSKLD